LREETGGRPRGREEREPGEAMWARDGARFPMRLPPDSSGVFSFSTMISFRTSRDMKAYANSFNGCFGTVKFIDDREGRTENPCQEMLMLLFSRSFPSSFTADERPEMSSRCPFKIRLPVRVRRVFQEFYFSSLHREIETETETETERETRTFCFFRLKDDLRLLDLQSPSPVALTINQSKTGRKEENKQTEAYVVIIKDRRAFTISSARSLGLLLCRAEALSISGSRTNTFRAMRRFTGHRSVTATKRKKMFAIPEGYQASPQRVPEDHREARPQRCCRGDPYEGTRFAGAQAYPLGKSLRKKRQKLTYNKAGEVITVITASGGRESYCGGANRRCGCSDGEFLGAAAADAARRRSRSFRGVSEHCCVHNTNSEGKRKRRYLYCRDIRHWWKRSIQV
jgi:hypothetical protein